jgi:hypothetical protein
MPAMPSYNLSSGGGVGHGYSTFSVRVPLTNPGRDAF